MEFSEPAAAGLPGPEKKTESLAVSNAAFPAYPGEDCLAHDAKLYQEQVEARFAARSLLVVAQGGSPPAADAIIDIDLSKLPPLPESHRDFNRREEVRIRIGTQNTANQRRRVQLTMEAWTEIYTLLKTSTETTAPVLSRELKEVCDLAVVRNIPGGYFDGPRAWQIVLDRLQGGKRTEMDKDFYRTAESVQRASHLPDGCSAADYSRKALAFLIHIKPFLPQSYDDDDTAQYLINLMPKANRSDGRRIRNELTKSGDIHDFMRVVKECRAVVHEEQKAAPPTPAFVLSGDQLEFDLPALERSTGMFLAAPGGLHGSQTTPSADGAFNATSQKWCPNCPHPGTAICFQAPEWAGPPPINIFLNKERWNGILAAKAANAKKAGIPNAAVRVPSRKDIDAYQKARKARREKREQEKRSGKDKPGGAEEPAGVALHEQDAWQDWRESLLDITLPALCDDEDMHLVLELNEELAFAGWVKLMICPSTGTSSSLRALSRLSLFV